MNLIWIGIFKADLDFKPFDLNVTRGHELDLHYVPTKYVNSGYKRSPGIIRSIFTTTSTQSNIP